MGRTSKIIADSDSATLNQKTENENNYGIGLFVLLLEDNHTLKQQKINKEKKYRKTNPRVKIKILSR